MSVSHLSPRHRMRDTAARRPLRRLRCPKRQGARERACLCRTSCRPDRPRSRACGPHKVPPSPWLRLEESERQVRWQQCEMGRGWAQTSGSRHARELSESASRPKPGHWTPAGWRARLRFGDVTTRRCVPCSERLLAHTQASVPVRYRAGDTRICWLRRPVAGASAVPATWCPESSCAALGAPKSCSVALPWKRRSRRCL